MKQNRKSLRMWKILTFAFTVFMQVYWYQIRKKSQTDKELLWERIGARYRELLFELEGLLIKVGQFLSMRADLLPNGFIKQIQDLVDHVPPSPWEDIKAVLEKEWGGPVESQLKSIDHKPVASASIGEVYQGLLKDGTKVAIKVQRPTIKSIIKTDFRSLSIIIWFAQRFAPIPKTFINFNMLFQELKSVIGRELDFNKELETVNHFRNRFMEFPNLKIPEVYPELSTSQVLVMEWVDGTRITDVDFLDKNSIDKEELAKRLMRIFIPQWLEAGIFHADPHAGNVMVSPDGTIILLDFGMVGEISKKDAENFQDLIQAILVKNYTKSADILMDLGFLLPEADRKAVGILLKEALSFDVKELKEKDLFKVKKELNEIVKSLPIQVPTRFVFLGRSFVTIEGMLLTISPDQEILDIAKPAFVDWLNQSNQNKWKLVLDWVNALPIFGIIHSVKELMDVPRQLMEQKEQLQQREFHFMIYENRKKQVFYFGMLGIASLFLGNHLQNPFIWYSSIGLIGISVIGYVSFSWKQRKLLKKI